jgi:hypothetical protein
MGADRSCAVPQGIHRIRQPLRRWDDRAAHLFLWLLTSLVLMGRPMSELTRCGAVVRRRADEHESVARRDLASMFFRLGDRSIGFCTTGETSSLLQRSRSRAAILELCSGNKTISSLRMKDSGSQPTAVELEHLRFASLVEKATRRFMTRRNGQYGSH